jgi:protoheme IX farnesyltransferase
MEEHGNTVSMPSPQTYALPASEVRRRVLRDFVELTKPRVVAMVLVTTAVGYYLGARDGVSLLAFFFTLLGTGLSAAGTLTLNQYVERDLDAMMERTRARPIPTRRVDAEDALVFGAALCVVGLLLLSFLVNPLSGMVTALTVASYLGLYTPMKRWTPLCGVVGAVPGALPPVTGWVAARGSLGAEAFVLFSILFLWQLPHSLAIARLYRDDYARAGFRLLPIVDRDGGSTERQIFLNSAALFAVGLSPTLLGMTGAVYFATALLLGAWMFAEGLRSALRPSADSARRLLVASLIYLPLLLGVMAWDKVPS